ncbi:hypothetical protein [Corallococcus exercitus]|uniref:Uncharacterized protein n=1 Tax=Corallococcus exercitus TaxID=2316736 RepID=A0A7Y4JNR7_9BACT|nr:hypothetical protein [Corallococcus exercitus]NOK08400.1 hypothetical protein [Corallococcus exercitus]
MSSDFALLFSGSSIPRLQAWQSALAKISAFRPRYLATITRLAWSQGARSWELTTQTQTAETVDDILAVMHHWRGVALEFETGFGPMKLLSWHLRESQSGLGLYLNSYLFALLREDPDVRSVFERTAFEMASAVEADLAVLVGDPSLRSWSPKALHQTLSRPPTPDMEPLVYWATEYRRHAQYQPPAHVAPGWIHQDEGEHIRFLHPSFAPMRKSED